MNVRAEFPLPAPTHRSSHVLRQTYARIQRDSLSEYLYMRQGMLLDLLFRTPAIPPTFTLVAIILNGILLTLNLQPILGNADTSDLDDGRTRISRSLAYHSRERSSSRTHDTSSRLYGGRPQTPSGQTESTDAVEAAVARFDQKVVSKRRSDLQAPGAVRFANPPAASAV